MSGAYQMMPVPVPVGMGGTGTAVGGGIIPSSTIGSLPAAASNSGKFFVVTDALAPALGLTVAAGGAVSVLVWSNGTNWLVV